MNTRILIVEDEAVTALDMKRELVSLGFDVAGICDNAADAVRTTAEIKPDLVLMDIRLSDEMDGIIAASIIRGSNDIPVVFLTAHSDEDTLKRALNAAPFGYLLKPFQARELKVCIDVAIYKHRKEMEARSLVRSLEDMLANVKKLSGLLPICSSCKKIRDGEGRWHSVEKYIQSHSEADFTHGICPDCAITLYPEMVPKSPLSAAGNG